MMLLLAGCVTSTVKPVREYKEFSKMTPAGNMVVADIEGTTLHFISFRYLSYRRRQLGQTQFIAVQHVSGHHLRP